MAKKKVENRGRPTRGRFPKFSSNSKKSKTLIFWLMILLLFVVGQRFISGSNGSDRLNYSQYMGLLQTDGLVINRANIHMTDYGCEFEGMIVNPDMEKIRQVTGLSGLNPRGNVFRFKTLFPSSLINDDLKSLWQNKIESIEFKPVKFNFVSFIIQLLPWILFIGVWVFILRQMQGGGSRGIFAFGKSKAKLLNENKLKITFDDVAGADEAKMELQEIIEFLKEPKKFQKLGGKLPKGALLVGAPGTGKTLLARAIAGEAGVPFFSMSGSDFVEMFVGVGASRVRDLFETGKKNAPCIIFVDEIDAVGRHRGAGMGGGHDEREQTLNQLLVEMDGFESNQGVIMIAATNRPDVLDPALLRPGRFDRLIVVDRPDIRGREAILKVHTKKIPLHKGVELNKIARGTPGLSGADLANLCNEAALLAARFDQQDVSMLDFEEAKDKIMMGVERKSLLITEKEKKVTAYHEAGHALLGKLLPHTDPVYKITIIPRGMAMGTTFSLPEEDKHNHSKSYLLNQICMLLGGRIAEELIFDEQTTGAASDIERATELARKMICQWGMSKKMGPIAYGKKQEQVFLGKEFGQHQDFSQSTAVEIDKEVFSIFQQQLELGEKILSENKEKLIYLAEAVLEHELLDGSEIDLVLTGEKLTAAKKTRQVKVKTKKPGNLKETQSSMDPAEKNKSSNRVHSKITSLPETDVSKEKGNRKIEEETPAANGKGSRFDSEA